MPSSVDTALELSHRLWQHVLVARGVVVALRMQWEGGCKVTLLASLPHAEILDSVILIALEKTRLEAHKRPISVQTLLAIPWPGASPRFLLFEGICLEAAAMLGPWQCFYSGAIIL